MNRKLVFVLLLILTLLAPACGGSKSPTDTPKPTKVPPPPPTDTPVPPPPAAPGLELSGETIRSEDGGFALGYPDGWEYFDIGGMAIIYESEEVLEEDVPSVPLVMVEGGALEGLSDGQLGDAQNSREMVEAVAASMEGDEPFEMGEIEEIVIASEAAALADISGEQDGMPIVGRILAIHMDDWGVLVVGAGTDESWEAFIPTFDAMLATLTLFEPTAPVVEEIEPTPIVTQEPTGVDVEPISQWASSAAASSQYSDPGWAATQVTGAPDTGECGDIETAWASSASDTVEWIELGYDLLVRYPTKLNIIQTYHPNQVVLVELIDVDGTYHEIYSGEPTEEDCPYTLSIAIEADYVVVGVKITLDQSVLGLGWNEIDAVELIGVPTGQRAAEEPPSGAGMTLQPPAPLPPVDAPLVELESGLYHYTNGNYVREIALHEDTLWAATGGGVVAWDLSTGDAVKYTTLDGLPANDVEAVTVCPIPEPRVIFATAYGLALYDPATGAWEQWNEDNSGMERSDPDMLDCDPDTNTLFIGYDLWGLDVYDASTSEWGWRFYDDEAGLASSFVSQAARVGDDIWVVSPFGVSVIAADGSITTFDEEMENIPDENVSSVAADAEGNVWLGSFDGLMKYSDGVFTMYNDDTVENFPFLDSFESVLVADDGAVWAGNFFGTICQFDPAAETCLFIYEDEAGMLDNLNDMFMDDAGNLYYCADGGGISIFDGSTWTSLILDELPLDNSYNVIAPMLDGSILVGGDFGLQRFLAYDVDAPWEEIDVGGWNNVYDLHPTAEGMWVGHSGGALFFEYASGEWTEFEKAEEAGQGIWEGPVTAITVDGAGRVWFGTYEGLTVWDGATYTYYDLLSEEEIAEERSARYVYSLFFDGSDVWVGGSGALFRFDADDEMTRWDDEMEGVDATFYSPTAYAFALHPDGSLLIGLDHRLLSYDGASFSELYKADSGIRSILTNEDGDVLLATVYDGIVLSDGQEWIALTVADGLASDSFDTSTVLLDYLDTLWFAADYGGLVRLVP